jgi:hypothetical protein
MKMADGVVICTMSVPQRGIVKGERCCIECDPRFLQNRY